MTDKTRGLLYASHGHANLAVIGPEKRDWLQKQFGIELTDAPACHGRIATSEEKKGGRGWAVPIDERKVTP